MSNSKKDKFKESINFPVRYNKHYLDRKINELVDLVYGEPEDENISKEIITDETKSSDVSASSAVHFIENTEDIEAIKDFMSINEDRVTVTRAYNKKVSLE